MSPQNLRNNERESVKHGNQSDDLVNKISLLLDVKLEEFRKDILSALKDIVEKVNNLEKKVAAHDNSLSEINARLNELEQGIYNSQIEISGLELPAAADYNSTKSAFLQLATSQHIQVDKSEVVNAFIKDKGAKSTSKTKPERVLIITLAHKAIKDRIMQQKIINDRNKEGVKIYFGHVLTNWNHKLLMAARQMRKHGRIFSAWSMDGKIYVKSQQDQQKTRVMDHEHLESLANENWMISKSDAKLELLLVLLTLFFSVIQNLKLFIIMSLSKEIFC